jgi:NAD(P)H-flavin reductase
MMPMVKYGFGAWSVIGWMVLTGFGYFRTLSHELFVLQHIAAAGILLWLVHVHIPSYAAYHVWLAVGFVGFDWIGRTTLVLARNLHVLPILKGNRLRGDIVGYPAQIDALAHNYLSVTIKKVDFSWRPGQHVYITVPGCGMFGLFEAHPFTIANLPDTKPDPQSTVLKFYFKVHSGFTKRLRGRCLSRDDQRSHRILVRGPWGNPPLDVIQRSDSLIFFATSTGAAFNMPILQSIIKTPVGIRRVRFYWVVRHFSQICWFEEGLNSALEQAESRGIDLVVQVFVTSQSSLERDPSEEDTEYSRQGQLKTLEDDNGIYQTPPSRIDTLDSISSKTSDLVKRLPLADPPLVFSPTTLREPSVSGQQGTNSIISPVLSGRANEKPSFVVYSGRPHSLDDLVRPTVEESDGETAIIGCGSGSFLAQLRNYTAALSDERAVHKGTGAQGIFLFVENYGW